LMFTSILSGQLISRTGRYKIFMQIGFTVATIAIFCLVFLTPESSYAFEAIVMVALGMGLGVAMPVLNLAVQNEFTQKDLGAATSSNQLFRSLGSTIGTAVFGAMLTAGILTQVPAMRDTAYIQSLASSPQVSKIGALDNPNTLLTLNTPDIKQKITDGATTQIEKLPEAYQQPAIDAFKANQDAFASKVTHAFSDSLQRIFITASIMMGFATVLVFTIKERKLHSASVEEAPGVE